MFGFFGKKKLLLAFEYGVVLSQVAQEHNIELTPDVIAKAEVMIENEAKSQSDTMMATQMVPNILSVFELDIRK